MDISPSLIKKTVILTDKNFLLFAAKNYTNNQCSDMEEFYSDLLTPIHIKKLLSKYKNTGILKERLVVNHLIGFFNVFTPKAAVKILFFRIEPELHVYLKTFLIYLNRCPDTIENLYEHTYYLKNLMIDEEIIKILNNNLDK